MIVGLEGLIQGVKVKMREKTALLDWLTPLYLVCVLCQSA